MHIVCTQISVHSWYQYLSTYVHPSLVYTEICVRINWLLIY